MGYGWRLIYLEDEFTFLGSDGSKINTYCWNDVTRPKGVIQIFHGMSEHAGRYKRFAEFLNQNGFIVYANDHRGHGKTAETVDAIGYIGEDGFNKIIEDGYILTGIIKRKHPGLRVVILGHSFGSFVAQDYITRYGSGIAGVILSGSAFNNKLKLNLGRVITAFQVKFDSGRGKAYLIDKMAFDNFNSRIGKDASDFAWLSSNEAEVKKYQEDPLCGAVLTKNFYYYFFKGLIKLHKAKKITRIPKSLSIYICSGEEDPVGSYGRTVRKLYELYRNVGIENVQIKLYPGARHEIINETNHEEVYSDIFTWLNKIIGG